MPDSISSLGALRRLGLADMAIKAFPDAFLTLTSVQALVLITKFRQVPDHGIYQQPC